MLDFLVLMSLYSSYASQDHIQGLECYYYILEQGLVSNHQCQNQIASRHDACDYTGIVTLSYTNVDRSAHFLKISIFQEVCMSQFYEMLVPVNLVVLHRWRYKDILLKSNTGQKHVHYSHSIDLCTVRNYYHIQRATWGYLPYKAPYDL